MNLIPSLQGRIVRCAVTFVITSFLSSISTTAAFPPEAGVIDVTAYGANGGDQLDDTAAITSAIAQNIAARKILYFPAGTYLVSDTLDWRDTTGKYRAYFTFVGENQGTTIIRLRNNAPGFTDPLVPRAVIRTNSTPASQPDPSGGGNEAFRNSIWNLTVDVGSGNPGAIGIDYTANNTGSLRNVTVKSSDPNRLGHAGISMLRSWPGPCLLTKVTVEGFRYGLDIAPTYQHHQYGLTMEHMTFRGQTERVIRNQRMPLWIRNVLSENSVEFYNGSHAASMLTLIGADLRPPSGGSAAGIPAMSTAGALHLRGVNASGYSAALSVSGTVLPGTTIAERHSNNLSLFEGPDVSMNLPVTEAPDFLPDWNRSASASNWIFVGAPIAGTTGDDRANIQAALNQADAIGGVVYFQANSNYRVSDTLTVGPNVRGIVGFWASLNPSIVHAFLEASNPRPVFEITGGGSVPVGFQWLRFSDKFRDKLQTPGAVGVQQSSSRPLVLRTMEMALGGIAYRNMPSGSGDLFIEDITTRNFRFNYPQRAFARQFNLEDRDGVFVANNAATLWVLGLKTEGNCAVIHTSAGAKTEMLGCLVYPIGGLAAAPPMFTIADGGAAALCFSSLENGYPVAVRETVDGVTAELPSSAFMLGNGKRHVAFYAGYDEAAPALPAPWQSADVGAVFAAGSGTLASGTWTVEGSGADIAGVADEFHFVSRTLSGNGTITARITAIENTNLPAKAGIMIRSGSSTGSPHAFVGLRADGRLAFLRRLAQDGTTSTSLPANVFSAPVWVRLERAGSILRAYSSTDGVSWVALAGSPSIPMAAEVMIGLAVTSRSDGNLCTSSMDNIVLTGVLP